MLPKKETFLLACVCFAYCTSVRLSSNNAKMRVFQPQKTTSCPCGVTKKGKVVGGTNAPANEYPWIAAVIKNAGHQQICGATILTEWIAITAAHCTDPKVPMSIKVGTSDISKGGLIVPLKGFTPHRYDPSLALNDISLLVFAWPITFSSTVSPVCLPTSKLHLDNQWVKILGWGMQGGNKPPTNHLMQADVQIVPFNECKKYHHGLSPSKSQLCIKARGKGGCYGDSGGPVVWLDPETNRYTLVGLVSFGSQNCDPEVPTVLTDVSTFVPWIRDIMHHPGCHKV